MAEEEDICVVADLGHHAVTLVPPSRSMEDEPERKDKLTRKSFALDELSVVSRLLKKGEEYKAKHEQRRLALQRSEEEKMLEQHQGNNSQKFYDPTGDAAVRLCSSHAMAEAKKAIMRERKEAHALEGCTFSPTITATANRLAISGSIDISSRVEKLQEWEHTKRVRREKLAAAKEQLEAQTCPMTPTVDKVSTSIITLSSQRQAFERLYERAKLRQKQRLSAPNKIETQKRIGCDGGVFDRLYEEGCERQQDIALVQPQLEKDVTFTPKLAKKSIALVGAHVPESSGTKCFERLHAQGEEQRAKREWKRKEAEEQRKRDANAGTYIGPYSRVLVALRSSSPATTARRKMEEENDAELSFHPKINDTSQILDNCALQARGFSPATDRLKIMAHRDEAAKTHLARLQLEKAIKEKNDEEGTKKENTPPACAQSFKRGTLNNRQGGIYERNLAWKGKLEQIWGRQREQEQAQAAQLTFSPKTTGAY